MHQVLARKYRPKYFNELVGQEHVSRALSSAIDQQRLHHAYLFTGTRGVGKTTIARIMAKCLNCESGITNQPCGVCNACTAIDQGRFIDCIEIDAASRTKVEDTRELMDNVPYAPSQGRYKVYIIDEVHMLSTHSFNALLKTLEEPPEHVKFLLATTDPQKLPVTVLSRCLQFNLRPLPLNQIEDHLANVLSKENISFEPAALWHLADAAQGSLRDALSVTDQAITYGQGKITTDSMLKMLGTLNQKFIVQLLAAIVTANNSMVASLIQALQDEAIDVEHVVDQLIALLHLIAKLQILPTVTHGYSPEVIAAISPLLTVPAIEIQLLYEIAIKGKDQLRLALNPMQGLEMTLLRMLAFSPAVNLPEPSPNNLSALSEQDKPILQSTQLEQLEPQVSAVMIQQVATEKEIYANTKAPVSNDTNGNKAIISIEATVDSSISEPLISEAQIVHPLSAQQEVELAEDTSNLYMHNTALEPIANEILSFNAQEWSNWVQNQNMPPMLHNICMHSQIKNTGGVLNLMVEKKQQLLIEQSSQSLQDYLNSIWPDLKTSFTYHDELTETPYQFKQQKQLNDQQQLTTEWLNRPEMIELQKQFDAKIEKVARK